MEILFIKDCLLAKIYCTKRLQPAGKIEWRSKCFEHELNVLKKMSVNANSKANATYPAERERERYKKIIALSSP